MNLKHRNYRTKGKYFTFLGCKKAGEKNEKKFANQLGDTMPTSIYFTNYRDCCSQVFCRVDILKISENS